MPGVPGVYKVNNKTLILIGPDYSEADTPNFSSL